MDFLKLAYDLPLAFLGRCPGFPEPPCFPPLSPSRVLDFPRDPQSMPIGTTTPASANAKLV